MVRLYDCRCSNRRYKGRCVRSFSFGDITEHQGRHQEEAEKLGRLRLGIHFLRIRQSQSPCGESPWKREPRVPNHNVEYFIFMNLLTEISMLNEWDLPLKLSVYRECVWRMLICTL